MYPFTTFKLFSRTQIDYLNSIDLQKQFKIFWQQQHPHRSSTSVSTNTSTTDCICENCVGVGSLWPLQNAVKFELNEYLSKQFTHEAFYIGLDPTLSQLNPNEKRYRQQLSNHASYDCLSMQRIILRMQNKNFIFNSASIPKDQYHLLQASPILSDNGNDTCLHTPPDLSSSIQVAFVDVLRAPSIKFLGNNTISHIPEGTSTFIYPTEQFILLSTSAQQSKNYDLETVSSDDADATLTTEEISQSTSASRPFIRLRPIHEELSEAERRKLHNRSYTLRQRRRYYRHEIIRRNIDRRFTITQVKAILRQFHIPFNAINISRSYITQQYSLYIGIRNPSKLHVYQRQTRSLFTTAHYNERKPFQHQPRLSSRYYHRRRS